MKERTLLNWAKWNCRGRPKYLMAERGDIGVSGKVIEHNVYVPDYLLDEYWRNHSHHYQMEIKGYDSYPLQFLVFIVLSPLLIAFTIISACIDAFQHEKDEP